MSRLSSNLSDSDSSYSESPDFTGCSLNHKYIMVTILGSGTDATVWLAFNIIQSKFYAIKVINAEDTKDGEAEIDVMKKLSFTKCEYINHMVEHFIWRYEPTNYPSDSDGSYSESESESDSKSKDYDVDEHVCIVYDLHCGSLYDVFKRGKYSNGLPFKVVVKMIHQLLTAVDCLNYEHNLLHTDIKPDNILLVGVSNSIKLIIDEFMTEYNKIQHIQHNGGKKSKHGKNKHKHKNKVVSKQSVERSVQNIVNKLSCNKETNKMSRSISDSKDLTSCYIDDSYLDPNNLTIKLADFCPAYEISKDMDPYIQTIYYRSPEIILDGPFNETCDVWSIGCSAYEMLTGKLLFDPDKKKGFNIDRCHMYDIQSMLGMLPKDMIDSSRKRKNFFRQNGLIKGVHSIKFNGLSNIIKNKVKGRPDIKEDELDLFIDFLYYIFTYDPKKRPNVKRCLEHPLFKLIK